MNADKSPSLRCNLEILIGEEWTPVVRYGTAHEEAHIDYINPKGVTFEKIWLSLHAPFNTAFTLAENDLKASYLDHRERFMRQIEGKLP